MVTSADINWELAPAPWPEATDLLERVVDLTTERDSYRLLAQQLLHALHDCMRQRDLLREQRRLDLQHRKRAT
jgi:hypothetical protein